MSAKEMFEKLGYEYIEYLEYCNSFCYKNKAHNLEGSWLEISFNLNIKTIDTYMCNHDSLTKFRCNIDMSLLQAINKQVEELGW